ncbi:MAG: hypothetical protein ACTSPG_05500 [Candidatus Hodarchaeales archaeon]
MKKNTRQVSINEFLNLNNRSWIIELDAQDFTSTLSKLMDIPLEIYKQNLKAFFLQFLRYFLQEASIAFILRHYEGDKITSEPHIDLAITGHWEKKNIAIPLWIMRDLLMGFEVLKNEDFSIIDSEILTNQSFYGEINTLNPSNHNIMVVLEDEIFQGSKLCLEINNGDIYFSKYFNDTLFLERIANTTIPELDEPEN